MKKSPFQAGIFGVVLALVIVIVGCDSGDDVVVKNQYRLVTQSLDGAKATVVLWKYNYNADGLLERVDDYDSSGNIVSFDKHTYNSMGLRLKTESYQISDSTITRRNVYEYDNNVLKTNKNYSVDSQNQQTLNYTIVYTFSGDRKIQQENINKDNIKTSSSTFQYDNSGKRISTHGQNFDLSGKVTTESTSTRTYNSDGTLSTVSFDNGQKRTFVWEQVKTSVDFDTFFAF